MTMDDACYFVDIFHKHVESVYPNLMGKSRNDAYLKLLCDDDDNGLESFVFDENVLSSENDNDLHDDLHDTLVVDDVNVNDGLCDFNDIEFVNFFDDCIDDAIYMPPKTRSKERAKKSKHDREGSSSGARQGVSDLIAPGGQGLAHLTAKQQERVEELQERGVSGGFYFDYTLLDAYGCRAEVERMMSQRYWAHLFSWRDDTYDPVVHEFIATFEPVPSNHMCTPSMKFALFGREYQVSFIQLGRYLGFYTQDDLNTDEWRNLPSDFDSDATVEAYWHRITGGDGGRFTGTKPNTSKIVSPTLKIMKFLLNLTFGGRHKNLYKVYRTDLFHLWSLEMNEPIQMACMGELAREKRIATMQPFSVAQLNRSYAPRIGDVPMHPQEEPHQQQEPVIEGGPDVPPEYADYPPVYDWASMRALQVQLHTHSMDTFNKRMDLQHEELVRQNEAILRQNEVYTRQEERQEQQFQAIE
nr:retrotransposon Orf1 [Ipomoea batatas]GMC46831.1 retrotransposon Orf1 [Ipomoea batatas]